jgi:hypothetical protein
MVYNAKLTSPQRGVMGVVCGVFGVMGVVCGVFAVRGVARGVFAVRGVARGVFAVRGVARGVSGVRGVYAPYPAKPVIGPALTPGGGPHPPFPCRHLSARFTGLLPAGYGLGSRVNAADMEMCVGEKGEPPSAEPGVNAGPNTALGGKAR